MQAQRGLVRGWVPALGASIPIIIIPITVLSIQLAASRALHLSPLETSSWIVSVYAWPGLLTLACVLRYRQPLILTGNVFALIFFGSLGAQLTYPEVVGASMLAGALVLAAGVFDLSEHVAAWLPAPIVLGTLAGAVVPYVAGVFTALGAEPLIVGGLVAAYLLGRRFLEAYVPAILPALVTGLVLAGLSARLGPLPAQWSLPALVLTPPSLSLHALIAATPVLVVLILVQSNLPSVVLLRSQGYQPPERTIDIVSGLGTLAGSLWGPTAVSLALPLVSLAGAPGAGEQPLRHRAAYIAGGALVLIGLLAGAAADLLRIIPLPLLLALAGLALLPVLSGALQAITRGPLIWGPLFAFAIALSQISLLGFGPLFWSLVLGLGVSALLEQPALSALRAARVGATPPPH